MQKLNIAIPQDAVWILNKLNEGGHEAYIVGGCVRDSILGRIPQDWDITTSALPEETKTIFDHTFDTGIKHGTITVVLHHENYEVTTYRIDGEYADCRHPDEVSFTKKLNEDLLRRDFTMNAIAYHPKEGFRDPFHGQEDIAAGIIRGVGEPARRFQEDALRMLRCVRFSAQLGFAIDPETWAALCANTALIQKISAERIREELQKLWLAPFANKMPLLWESGLLAQIDATLSASLIANSQTLLEEISLCPKDNILRWCVFAALPIQWSKLFQKVCGSITTPSSGFPCFWRSCPRICRQSPIRSAKSSAPSGRRQQSSFCFCKASCALPLPTPRQKPPWKKSLRQGIVFP